MQPRTRRHRRPKHPRFISTARRSACPDPPWKWKWVKGETGLQLVPWAFSGMTLLETCWTPRHAVDALLQANETMSLSHQVQEKLRSSRPHFGSRFWPIDPYLTERFQALPRCDQTQSPKKLDYLDLEEDVPIRNCEDRAFRYHIRYHRYGRAVCLSQPQKVNPVVLDTAQNWGTFVDPVLNNPKMVRKMSHTLQ